MLGHGENSIFEALIELHESFPSLPIRPVIADVREFAPYTGDFFTLPSSSRFHAAAHKHVPLMEVNIEDAVTNNILAHATWWRLPGLGRRTAGNDLDR